MVLCIKLGMSWQSHFLLFLTLHREGRWLVGGADHSGSEGEGKGSVVSLAGRGSGKKDQS